MSEPLYPTINVTDQPLDRMGRLAWKALLAANNPPVLFNHGGEVVRVESDGSGSKILRRVTEDRMRYRLARVAHWVRSDGKGNESPALPPVAVVKDVLATPNLELPALDRLVGIPIFAPDGTLITKGGYSPSTQTYCAPTKALKIPNVPAHPTAADIERARSLIVTELLGDFPFTSESERAHAIAAFLLPYVRTMIDGPTPLHLIEKPTPGTGASLLANVLTYPALGTHVSAMSEGKDEEEWRRRILAKLSAGPAVILIDNIKHPLRSSALSTALTAYRYEDRRIGTSEVVSVPVRCVWLATGNNPILDSDIARRTVRIRLDAKVERPWLGRKFRHPNLTKWVIEQRPNLIWAALVLTRAWVAEGCPAGTEVLGMFESWSSVMGGILDTAGIPGFLGNLAGIYEESDSEGAAWRAFVEAWWSRQADRPVRTSELLPEAQELDLGTGDENSRRIRLGKHLARMKDRQFSGFTILSAGRRQGSQLWKLQRAGGDGGG
jgi:putative DNA primase/helicase